MTGAAQFVVYDEAALRGLRDEIAAWRARGNDARALWGPVIEAFVGDEKQVFATRGRSIGTPWDPPSKRSQQSNLVRSGSKKKARRSTEQGVLTGRMRRSLTATKAVGAVRRRRRDEVVLGTRSGPANIYGPGTSNGRQPARPLINITPRRADEYVDLIADQVFGTGRRSAM